MKNLMRKTFALALVLTIALGAFTACGSDDDDKDSGSGIAAKVVGTYAGNFKSVAFTGDASVVVTATGDSEVLVTFASVTGIAPFKVKLVDTGVQGIMQSTIDPICQFYTLTGTAQIVSASKLYTFSGEK